MGKECCSHKADYKLKYKDGDKKFDTYIPLHGHSTYSQGDGVTKIADIIKRTKEIGADAVSLTEHGNMSSFYKFWKEAKANDVKPIVGCELYLNDLYYSDREKFLKIKRNKGGDIEGAGDAADMSGLASNNHQLVYCKNYEGVKNLIGLSNVGFEEFYRKPLVDTNETFERLDTNNIVTTGCLQSIFNQQIREGNEVEAIKLIKKWHEKFGEDFYLEVQLNQLKEQHQCNAFYNKVYDKTGIKPVFALDYHYANKDDWYIQYLLYCIKQRGTVNSYPPEDWFYNVRDLYIKEIDEIYTRAEKWGMDKKFLELAIDSTFEIRDKVDIEMPSYPDNFPKFTESTKQSDDVFRSKLKVKWQEKLANGLVPKDKIDEYQARMKYELGIIYDKGFVDYFLILDDLLNNFVYKVGGATGAGRGSAGGSLVLFILDITKIDPIRHNLIFERFLNPARIDPADVDLDITSAEQKQCEDYLKKKFGDNKVCHIANFGKFGAKTIVKDLCRIYELDFGLSNKLTSYFNDVTDGEEPVSVQLKSAKAIAQKRKENDLVKFIDDNYETLTSIGNKMVGMVRQTGRHASGILVSNEVLNKSELPVLRLKGDIVSGVQEGGDEREVAELGYCKLDILGLKTASVINDTFKAIYKKHGKTKDLEREILLSDFDDEGVYKAFGEGNCRDIFQFGSDNMINLIKQIQPKTIIDLSSINAMFRPAIIEAGGIDEYLHNMNDAEAAKAKSDAMHPKLWNIWGESFGVPIFQEQIMFILQDIGGFNLAEADKGRKILKLLHKGNQSKNTNFLNMMDQFRKGALENGMSEDDTNTLLDILGKYSEYSFNKSHSLAYAMNAYVSMWQKVHYPLEYYSALLNYSTQSEMSWFVKQIKKQDISFNPIKMGHTAERFGPDYKNGTIKFGLNLVKGLNSTDIEKLNTLEPGQFKDEVGLIEWLLENKVTKRSYEPLCRLGYFSDVFNNSHVLEHLIGSCRKLKKSETIKEKIVEALTEHVGTKNWNQNEFFKFEKQYLDFYFNEHPFDMHVNIIKEVDPECLRYFISPKQFTDDHPGGTYIIYGIINDIIIKKSKKTGREYYRILLEDDEKQMYITVFNSRDMGDVHIGDFITMEASKNKFGFTKAKNTQIKKLID